MHCKEIAAIRIREFLFELGAEVKFRFPGWIAYAVEKAGFACYGTGRGIINGSVTSVGPDVVEQISRHTGCPISVFYDAEA